MTPRPAEPPRARRLAAAVVLAAVAAAGPGCAALTNPVADGVPVRRLPAEVRGRPKTEMVQLPLTLLRLKEPDAYRLDTGDILAIVAGDQFGGPNSVPPVSVPTAPDEPAAVGYPVPVQEGGIITLPDGRYKPIKVKGMTILEVEQELRDVLINGKGGNPKLFQEGQRISAQLLKKRRYRVTVIREDTQPYQVATVGGAVSQANRRNGITLFLEPYKNDVLTALNLSGGPPNQDAKNEVIIQRGQYDPARPEKGFTRIPLRFFPDEQLTLSPADITMNEGDILIVPTRESEVFYTGGILGSRQIALPRDYDLNVLQAIALVGGPLANGGFTQNAFVAQSFASGIGFPSPALVTVLRRLPNGQQLPIRVDLNLALKDPRERILIQPNDFLIMQEKPGDAIVRYLTQQFRFNTTVETIRSENIFQTLTGTVP